MTTNNPITNDTRRIKLSLHKKDYSGSATNYKPEEIEVTILKHTLTHYNYSPIVWRREYRAKINFAQATGFCVDIDKGMTIPEAETILRVQKLNYALITTRSHTEDAHRFRIYIPFNRPIYTLHQYQRAAKAIDILFGSHCDPTVFDGARQLYASPEGSYFSNCWTGTDYDVSAFVAIDLSAVEYGEGDFDDNLLLRNKEGQEILVSNIKQKTVIYCPWHNDNYPSAFIDFSEKSKNWYIHCTSTTCNKTYWKTKHPPTMEERCEPFWSHSNKIYETGILGDSYYFKEIGDKKFYTFVQAYDKEQKGKCYDWLLRNHHIPNILRIDFIGNPELMKHEYNVDKSTGLIEVRYAPIASEVQDNQFIDDYLKSVFGVHKEFIKQYMAVYAYTDFKKLPTLILVGDRGVGKSKFAEMMAEIYPTRSQHWKASDENFNPELHKKLLIADETLTDKRDNYNFLKRLSGQNYHMVNEKFLPKFQVRNNVNVIILSNKMTPLLVEKDELPTDPANNQFFVTTIKRFSGPTDATLHEKLKSRIGHYVRTELKRVFQGLDITKYRYSIPVPITLEEKKLFGNSISIEQINMEKFIQETVNQYDSVNGYLISGYCPVEHICNIIGTTKQEKAAIVRNLKEQGYLSDNDAIRVRVDKQRYYCYSMTDKMINKINSDINIDDVLQRKDPNKQKVRRLRW